VLASFYLMLNLPAGTWVRFFIWMAIGVVVYFLYGRTHSRLHGEPVGRHGRPAVVDVRDSTVSAGEQARDQTRQRRH
jgi:hypothetical protein